jgi:uncharacterized protein YrrD
MPEQPETLKQSELIHRLVIDRHTAEEVGRVAKLLLDSQAHRLAGIVCQSGFLGRDKQTFSWAQVEAIGTDSILIKSNAEEGAIAKAEPLESPIGHEVWTDGGNKVGRLVDYLLNPQTGAVLNYLYASSGWRGVMEGTYLLPPAAISSVGRKRIIVLETVVENSQQYGEGLHQRFGQATEFLKQDFEKTKQDWEGVREGMQNFGEQLQDKTQAATEQVKEKASDVTEQFQQKSESTDTDTNKTPEAQSDSTSSPPGKQ